MPNQRHQLTMPDIANAMEQLDTKLTFRLKQKGMGTFASSHEIFGILVQELSEFEDEVHNRIPHAQVDELLDIAVAAIVGIASIQSGGVDW